MKVEIIGVYAVDAREPCHLVELRISDHIGEVDIGRFTQEWPGKDRSSWQVPWDERVLNEEGTKDAMGRFPRNVPVDGSARVAFFFHYLNFDRPLITPAGKIRIPDAGALPKRLRFMEYKSPC
jgi:hypothetical protein